MKGRRKCWVCSHWWEERWVLPTWYEGGAYRFACDDCYPRTRVAGRLMPGCLCCVRRRKILKPREQS